MCELLGISSNLSVTANLSLEELARHGGITGPHKDGWGVAYYEDNDVRLIKEAKAAAGSEWIEFVRNHDLRSHIILSHIRKATMGRPSFANTQPFIRELGGRIHVFAHNGKLEDVQRKKSMFFSQYRPVGETDSELAFCVLLERLSRLWRETDGAIPLLSERYDIVSGFAHEVAPLGPANFLYSDGDAIFAHGNRRTQAASGEIRPPGMYWHCRRCEPDGPFDVEGVNLRGQDQSVALVASVPLSDENWLPMKEGEVLCLKDGEVRFFDPPSPKV